MTTLPMALPTGADDDLLHPPLDAAGMKRRTVHGAGATAAVQFVKFVLQFSTQIALARMLDPAQFGIVAMVAPVLGLVLTLNDFGFGQAVVQRAAITQRQVSALFWLSAAIGTGFTVVFMLAAPLVAAAYGEPRTLGVTVALSSLILLSALSIVPSALLARRMRFVALGAIELASMAVGLASGLVSAWLGLGYWSLVVMQAANTSVSLLLTWAACGWRPRLPAPEPGVGQLARFGAHLMGSNLAGYLSTSADNVIVGVANGNVALGLYDRSYNLVVKPLMQMMAPAGRVAVPLLSRLVETPERYARAFLLMLQATTTACVPGLIATIVAAEPLILALLGPKWAAMVPVFSWICAGGVASALSASCYWLLTTQGRAREQMRASVVVAVIGIVAFAIGSAFGVVGVAMAAALSFVFVQTPILVAVATRRGPVTASMLAIGLRPLLFAGLAAVAAALAVVPRLALPPLAVVAVSMVLAYGVFLLALLGQPDGRRMAVAAWALVGRRRQAT